MLKPDISILLVEDDQLDVRAITRALRQINLDNPIYVARDGVEALQMLRGEAETPPIPRPYLIILDLNLPRMNGTEFLHEVRADRELASSVVFVLTTSNNEQDRIAAYQDHVAGYLLKSSKNEDFMKAIQLIGRYLMTVQFPPK